MEKKLEQYRAEKRRKERFENIKAKLRKMIFGPDPVKEDSKIEIPEVHQSLTVWVFAT